MISSRAPRLPTFQFRNISPRRRLAPHPGSRCLLHSRRRSSSLFPLRKSPFRRSVPPSPPARRPERYRPALQRRQRRAQFRRSPRLLLRHKFLRAFPPHPPPPSLLHSARTPAWISRKCSASLNTILKSEPPPPKRTPKPTTTSASPSAK